MEERGCPLPCEWPLVCFTKPQAGVTQKVAAGKFPWENAPNLPMEGPVDTAKKESLSERQGDEPRTSVRRAHSSHAEGCSILRPTGRGREGPPTPVHSEGSGVVIMGRSEELAQG